jgi:hypothetical protein
MADSSIGFGFLCRPMTGADASVSARVNVLLNQDWPTDTLLQVSLWTSPDINRRKSSRAELSQNRWHTRYPVSEKSF